MDNGSQALYPAILMLDQRSRLQAQRIIDTIGMEAPLNTTANMPVAGVFRWPASFGSKTTYLKYFKKLMFSVIPTPLWPDGLRRNSPWIGHRHPLRRCTTQCIMTCLGMRIFWMNTDEEFFYDFMPQAIDEWSARKSGVIYIPFN